jgi:hypothetical protein
MADVAIAIRTYLLSKSAVTTLVGTRIYSDIVEQNATLPAIAMSKISTRHDHTLSDMAGLAHCRLQFDCYADTATGGRATANSIAETIRATGICAIKGTYTSVDIRGVRLESGQRNEIDYARDDSDDHRYVTSFDLEVDYTETI